MFKETSSKIAVFVALIASVLFWTTYQRLETVEDQLEMTEKVVELQRDVLNSASRIIQSESNLNRRLDEIINTIEEAPNAHAPISPDVAAAWGNGIDSLRNEAGVSPVDGSSKDLPRSDTD